MNNITIEQINALPSSYSKNIEGDICTIPGLLNNKVAIITGSSQGIGKSIAEIFVENGACVVINGRNPDPCFEVSEGINSNHGRSPRALAYPADVTDSAAVKNMVEAAIKTFGKVDILVNNAGTSRDALIHKMEDKLLSFIVDLSLRGTDNTTRAIVPHFNDEEIHPKVEFKKIINFSSTTGITGNIGQTNYALAKSGVIGYSKACARELCLQRINVNLVAPGFTHTRMTDVKTDPDSEMGMPVGVRNTAINATPFAMNNRAGEPYHNANVVLFLASYLSDWITGQVITVDGGLII